MARRYTRDAKGRFAPKGYSGQTGGRGARLKGGAGNSRKGGGAVLKMTPEGKSRKIAVKGKTQKSLSEGQRYANTQAQAKATRQAALTQRLESFNNKTQARLDAQTKPPGIQPPRGDTASVNRPMAGSRGRQLDAEISRRVKADKAIKRAESIERNKRYKSDQSEAKRLRAEVGGELASRVSAKTGKPLSEVKAAIKSMPPAKQVALLRKEQAQQKAKSQSLNRLTDAKRQNAAATTATEKARADLFAASGSNKAAAQQRLSKAEAAQNAAKENYRQAKLTSSSADRAAVANAPGSYAARAAEQAKGRVTQFTQIKKNVDSEIRQVRDQIKTARKNAMTFGDVPSLKLRLLSLQDKSKEYKLTIERAKQAAKG